MAQDTDGQQNPGRPPRGEPRGFGGPAVLNEDDKAAGPAATGIPEGTPSVTNLAGQEFPRIHPDGRVAFRLKAPEAKTMAMNYGKPHPMERGPWGTLTITMVPIVPGIHYYSYSVDGINVCDPATETFYRMSRITSGFEVPAPGGDFCLANDVLHGEVRERRSISKSTQAWRHIFVYTPPDYDAAPPRAIPPSGTMRPRRDCCGGLRVLPEFPLASPPAPAAT